MEEQTKVLEWEDATEAEQEVAGRIAKKLNNDCYFSYNLPLQFYRDEDTKKLCSISNYMPRKSQPPNPKGLGL